MFKDFCVVSRHLKRKIITFPEILQSPPHLGETWKPSQIILDMRWISPDGQQGWLAPCCDGGFPALWRGSVWDDTHLAFLDEEGTSLVAFLDTIAI